MKKITSILMSMVLVLTLVSCGNGAEKAKEQVTTFSETMQTGDMEKILQLLDDEEVIAEYNTLKEGTTEAALIDKIFSYLKDITFEVQDAVDNGDGTYSVDVNYTYVDASVIFNATMTAYTDAIMNDYETYVDYTPEQFEELFMQTYAEVETTTEKTMISGTVTFTVEKVDGELVISDASDSFYDVFTAGLYSTFSSLEG